MLKFLNDLKPDFTTTLTALPIAELKTRGVKVLAFDVDNTLTHTRARLLSDEYSVYLKDLSTQGFKLFFASNAVTDITNLGESVGATVVRATWITRKPLRRYFNKLIAETKARPNEIAMIGDHFLNDIWGGNRSGLVTVKIKRV